MKTFKKFLAILLLVLIIACSKDSNTPDIPVATNLLITTISPTTGPKNTVVTIIGTGFSTTTANNIVTINGKACPVLNSTATQLTITIPPSAGSGNIKVVVGNANAESNNFDFVVTTTVTTIAGSASGFEDGQGAAARFLGPYGITIDALGNLFLTDFFNSKIRKISPTGLVTTIAGSNFGFANGQGTSAEFSGPVGITVDSNGNLFVADDFNNRIRKISSTGLVTTFAGSTQGFADGQGTAAKFSSPSGIINDGTGNMYVTDRQTSKIRKISPSGLVTTIAGGISGFANGQGTAAQFLKPIGLAIDATGNLFIADKGNHKIRKISPTGFVSTIAGSTQGFANGEGTVAQFDSPDSIVIDNIGNLYVTEVGNDRIRKISITGVVSTVAGSSSGFNDGIATTAQFNDPLGITIDNQGNLYVADSENHKIRKITFD